MTAQTAPAHAERDSRIEQNAALVYAVAKRFYGRQGIENEDIVQAGFIGLLHAAERFDPARGFQFSTYAVPLIIGEIKMLLRASGAVHVSRGMREKAVQAAQAVESFRAEEGREPHVDEVAARLGMSAWETALALSSAQAVESLDAPEAADPAGDAFPEDKLALLDAINRLPPRERRVIFLRYFREMPQREVAEALGLSQPQASRIEKRALEGMREGLI